MNSPLHEDEDFTPTERKMLQVLSDGMYHRATELQKCLYDELASVSNIEAHLSHMRKKLKSMGLRIKNNRLHPDYRRLGCQYQLVRTEVNPYDGKG